MVKKKYLESTKLSILLFVFMFVLYAVVYMTKSMFSSAMAAIVQEGFMTKAQTGLINAIFWLVYAPLQIVGGFAVDKFSPYKLVIIGIIGAAVSNLIIFFNQSYPVMIAAWTLNAILQFGLWPGVFKIVSTQITPRLRDMAVFWLMFATSAGLGLSMFVASFVEKWQNNFIISVISLVFILFALVITYNLLEKKMTVAEVEMKEIKTDKEKAPLKPLMAASGLGVLMAVTLLRTSIDNGMKMLAPVLFMESYDNLPASIATRMSTTLVIFSALGIFLAGFVKTRITGNETKAQIVLLTMSIIPLAICCFAGRVGYIWVLFALSVATMLIHGAAPFGQSYVSIRFEKYGRIGTATGLLNATASIGNILASYTFAKMSEIMPWNMVVFSWLIVILICVAACLLVLKKWTCFIKKGW